MTRFFDKFGSDKLVREFPAKRIKVTIKWNGVLFYCLRLKQDLELQWNLSAMEPQGTEIFSPFPWTQVVEVHVCVYHTDCKCFSAKDSVLSCPHVPFFFFPYQQSEYWVFCELMCWLSGSLTCRLPDMMRSPPARRSRKFNHCWLIFGSS
jgi:hypothetical protein